MNENELRYLCQNAALAITGQRVKIRLEHPVTKNFDGEVYNSPDGYVINIDPALSDENFIWVLCHELGHVKINHKSDIPYDRTPGSLKLTPASEIAQKVKPELVQKENEAQSWGDKYLKYANENCDHYSGFTKLERQIRALSGYLSPAIYDRMSKIAIKAGTQATEFIRWQQNQLKKG